jgi:hypothetical protein
MFAMSRSDKKLLAELIGIFDQVRGVPFKRFRPDDWRTAQPTSFNCSSFAKWLGLRCLGWGDRERMDARIDQPSATGFLHSDDLFPDVDENDVRPGDLLVYVDRDDELQAVAHCMISLGWQDRHEVIGACDTERKLVRRPATYAERWQLARILRIRGGLLQLERRSSR